MLEILSGPARESKTQEKEEEPTQASESTPGKTEGQEPLGPNQD